MPNDWSIQLFDITIPCLRTYEIDSLISKFKVIRIQVISSGELDELTQMKVDGPNLDGPTV